MIRALHTLRNAHTDDILVCLIGAALILLMVVF